MELHEINILLLLFSILYFCNHLSNSYIFISTGIYILIYIFSSKNFFLSHVTNEPEDEDKNNFVFILLYIFFNFFSFIISLVSLSSIGDKQNRIITNIQIKRIGHILTLVYLTMIMMYIIYKLYKVDQGAGVSVVLGKVIILVIILLSISFITFIYPKLNVFTNNYKCHELNQSNIKQTFDCDVEPILT